MSANRGIAMKNIYIYVYEKGKKVVNSATEYTMRIGIILKPRSSPTMKGNLSENHDPIRNKQGEKIV